MQWQDMVLTGGQWILIIGLLPTIFHKEKPAVSTSVITGVVLAIFAFSFYTLTLTGTAITVLANSGLWWILAYQGYKKRKRKK